MKAEECKTVKEAVAYLRSHFNQDDIETLSRCSKDEMSQYHHSLGMWIRNNMGLWGDNEALKRSCLDTMHTKYPEMERKFSAHWKMFGVKESVYAEGGTDIHADDASSVILDALWDDLHSLPMETIKKVEKSS